VHLNIAERDALRAFDPVLMISPATGTEGVYDVTPGSRVGAIDLPDLAITIRPKIPVDRVLFLISYALDPKGWQQGRTAGLEEAETLVEAIVPSFTAHLRWAAGRGLLQGYRPEEDSLQTVRGRVRFEDQLRRRYGRYPPIEVRYDEFTEDIEENRLLKAAISRLSRLRIRSDVARASLRQYAAILSSVQLIDYDPRHLPTIWYDRLNGHYRGAVELAKLILRSTSFDLEHGRVVASAFSVDINEVFENFVVAALREELRLSERAFPQGAAGRRLILDQARRVALRPDISWWENGGCVFVGDVKYKRVAAAGILHPDLYQMLAYTVATDLPAGLLIYAAGEGEPVVHEILNAGKRLAVTTLDVEGTPDRILGDIRRLANQVRWTRRSNEPDSMGIWSHPDLVISAGV
jgi:5-methylcytosine-specific restriction enzyme subunit McrC